jgi:excinuclease ABC subunit A
MSCRARPAAASAVRDARSALKGKSIADVLEMSVEEASPSSPRSRSCGASCGRCTTSGSTTSARPAGDDSGGERSASSWPSAGKIATGRTLYILDEPTTGLHFADIEKLLSAAAAGGRGNTVLVIEHNLDVIKQADWIVDLGPEGARAAAR